MEKEKDPPKEPSQLDTTQAKPEQPPLAVQNQAEVTDKSSPSETPRTSITKTSQIGQPSSAIQSEAEVAKSRRASQLPRVSTTKPIAAQPQPLPTIRDGSDEFEPLRFSQQLRLPKMDATAKPEPSSAVRDSTDKPRRFSLRSREASATKQLEPQQEPKEAQRRDSFPSRIISRVLDTLTKSKSSPKTSDLDVPADSAVGRSTEKRSSLKPIAEDTRGSVDGVELFKSEEPRKMSSAYNPFGSFHRGVSIAHPEKDADRRLSTVSQSPRVSISEKRPPGVVVFPEKTRRSSTPRGSIAPYKSTSRRSLSPRTGRPRSVSVIDLTTQDVAICFFPEEPDWDDDDDDDDEDDDEGNDDDDFDFGLFPPIRGRSDSIFPDPNTPYDWSQRERWHSRLVYLIALVTYSISFSNIYHFPALVYHYGGIPFLIPYTIFTLILGYPLHFLESSLGQYSQSGPVRVWDAAPIARGVGWSMFFLCLVIAYYYNMYAAYSVIYFSRCFSAILPWLDCDEPATSNYSCVPRMCVRQSTNHYTPAEHFFFHHVLQIRVSSEILGSGLGPMVWTQVVGFLFAWIVIYAAIIQSVRSIGKIVFVLVILPYFILVMLLTAGLMLQGSSRGLELLFTTNFNGLLDIQLWRVAAEEVFFELGICQGTPLAFGSYCHHRNPTHIDSAIICAVNYFTSILCALVIFLILGALAMEIGAPVADVLHHGPGIVFIAYPEALSRVPGSHIWCFMFFLMLFSVAVGTQIAIMETVMTVVYDEFQNARPYRWMINLLICCCLFLLGIVLCTSNGYFVVHLLDRMSGTMPRLPIAVCMVGTIVLIYGTSKYYEDVHFMIGYYPNAFTRICLSITPFLLLALTIPSWILKKPLTALNLKYSPDAINVGWFTIWFILVWIFLGAIYWCMYCYSIGQMSGVFRSLNSWGPRSFEARVARTEFSSEELNSFTKPWTKKAVRIEAGDAT